MIAHNNKLILLLIVVVLLPQCVAIFPPLEQQQQDALVIVDSFAARGIGTGNSPDIIRPFLELFAIVSILALMPINSPTTTASVDDVSLPQTRTQALSTTVVSSTTNTPCVPTSCPPGYTLLADENAGPNCYLFSGHTTGKSRDEARRSCATTPGAFLWNPNSETEANAVKSKFNFIDTQGSWVGGKKDSSGKFVFEIDDVGFLLNQQSIPFGGLLDDSSGNPDSECLVIVPVSSVMNVDWFWGPITCSTDATYVCEFQRKVCP